MPPQPPPQKPPTQTQKNTALTDCLERAQQNALDDFEDAMLDDAILPVEDGFKGLVGGAVIGWETGDRNV